MLLLIALITILLFCLVYVVVVAVRLNDKLDELANQLEESLDIIDSCYQRISKTSQIPVVSDEPVIQQLINDIKEIKNSILLIANKLVTFDDVDES